MAAPSLPSPTCGGTGGMLPAERARASFPIDELVRMMRGDRVSRAQKYRDELFSGAPFDTAAEDPYLSYQEKFERRFSRAARAFEIVRSNPRFMADHTKQRVSMGEMFKGDASAAGIHFSMFLTYIETQGTAEQLARWRGPARQGRMMGCYAQTELGHGSNVRGIETLATYDAAAEEFVIHSPTLTSLKWWPSGMYSATHGMVFARLVIRGKDYGFHGFLVQFRDDAGRLMPGVEIGEIGPKLSTERINIGYARFTHVRVPRSHLFARGASVAKDGTYTAAPPKLSRFRYVSMMNVRVEIVRRASIFLGQAATIAVRYSCVRRQGFKDSLRDDAVAGGEHTLMDYQNQQYRTLKAVALAYMFRWNGKYVTDYLESVQRLVVGGDAAAAERAAEEMPELHATCAGLKATATVWAHNTMEDLRKACGGQGYLLSSGIAGRTCEFAAPVTAEGEQVILSLQVARFLLKAVAAVRGGGTVSDTAAYLAEPAAVRGDEAFLVPGATAPLLSLLADRARRAAGELRDEFDAARAGGAGFDAALNDAAVTAVRAAEFHSKYVMARNNAAALEKYVGNAAIRAAMQRLFELMVLQQVREGAGDWVDVLSSRLVRACHARVKALLGELRPDAVALVDGFGFADTELRSTLGRHDGNVYEAIYDEARRSPLNQSPKMVGWDAFSPALDLDILRDGMRTQRSARL